MITEVNREEAAMWEELEFAFTEQIEKLISYGGNDDVIDLLGKNLIIEFLKAQRVGGFTEKDSERDCLAGTTATLFLSGSA